MPSALELPFPAFNDCERRDGWFFHGQSTTCEIIGVDDLGPNGGNTKLALLGTFTGEFASAGQWYWLEGCDDIDHCAQSGQWRLAATLGVANTVFTCSKAARVDDRQVGWLLQPDLNAQVFLPITSVDENSHTVTVAGNYVAVGEEGKRFRIHAPPGVEVYGANAGLLSRWTSASSSRCLYAGYRYESPLAGHKESTGAINARQSGQNYAGLHYTLHRHYDPSLMRFTSADPIASRANLFAYCDNNPHRSYDPDGLSAAGMAASVPLWFIPPVGATMLFLEAWDTVANIGNGPSSVLVGQNRGQGFDEHGVEGFVLGQNTYDRWNLMTKAGRSEEEMYLSVGAMWLSDQAGTTSFAEAWHGADSVTGNGISGWDRAFRGVAGTLQMLTYAAPVAGKLASAAKPLARLARQIAPQPRYFSPMRASRRGAVLNPLGGGKRALQLRSGQAGKFADLAKMGRVGDELTPHHMPQAAQGFTANAKGGALMLKNSEHMLTRTYGSAGRATLAAEKGMPFRSVLARDIRDIRTLFGSRYNAGLRDLLRYYRNNFPQLMGK